MQEPRGQQHGCTLLRVAWCLHLQQLRVPRCRFLGVRWLLRRLLLLRLQHWRLQQLRRWGLLLCAHSPQGMQDLLLLRLQFGRVGAARRRLCASKPPLHNLF
jgi:hypothetical protein